MRTMLQVRQEGRKYDRFREWWKGLILEISLHLKMYTMNFRICVWMYAWLYIYVDYVSKYKLSVQAGVVWRLPPPGIFWIQPKKLFLHHIIFAPPSGLSLYAHVGKHCVNRFLGNKTRIIAYFIRKTFNINFLLLLNILYKLFQIHIIWRFIWKSRKLNLFEQYLP